MNEELMVKIWNKKFLVGRKVLVDGCELPTRTATIARMVNGVAMISLADWPLRGFVSLGSIRPVPSRVREEML